MAGAKRNTEIRRPSDRTRGWTASIVFTPSKGVAARHYRLVDPVIRIDRTPGAGANTIVLDDPGISKGQVSLRSVDGGYYELEDSGSRNPVRVNGVNVRRAILQENDVVRVGDSLIVFDRDDPARGARLRSTLVQSRVDDLMNRLLMTDSTASYLLRLDASLIEPDYGCIAIWTPGAKESRLTSDWLAESWDQQLSVVEAVHENAAQRVAQARPDEAILVDRMDFASPSKMLELSASIERRINGRTRALTIMTIDGKLRDRRPPIVDQVVSLCAQFELSIPSLSERKVDILGAMAGLVEELTGDMPELSVDLCEHMLCYPWHGEISEMQRTARWLTSILKRGQPLMAGVLPSSMRSVNVESDASSGQEISDEAVLRAFHEHDGNMSAVAEHFGYSRTYFYKLMKSSGIDVQDLRRQWAATRED